MTSLRTPSSPNCLQLRFGLRCRESSFIFLRIPFRPSNLRIRLVFAADAAARDGGKGDSWNSSSGSPDSFAGWSDAESGGEDSQKKGGFGGILGAGLAGVFFAAGITFAILSLHSKSASGAKVQMEPLTKEQEVLVTSDDMNAVADQAGDESNLLLPDKESKINYCNSDYEMGAKQNHFSHTEFSEDASEGRFDYIHQTGTSSMQDMKSSGDGIDTVHLASSQDVLDITLDANSIPVPAGTNTSPAESSAYDIDLSYDISEMQDSQSTTQSGTLDSVIGHDADKSTVTTVDLSSPNAHLVNHVSVHQDGNLSPVKMVDSEVPLDFTSQFESELPSEQSTPNLILPESVDLVDSQVRVKGVMENADCVSQDQDIEQNGLLQHPPAASISNPVVHDINETTLLETVTRPDFDQSEELMLSHDSISFPEGHKTNESTISVAHSISVSSEPNDNELDLNSYNQIQNGSLSESLLPEKSWSHAGIPAPSLLPAALQVPPGEVLVPAVVDQVQGQALAALQVLKVIEVDVQPGELCTRREYARWLVSASSALSRNTLSKVYPAMYIENVSELAFDDVTPEDPDFPYIQGLAEAGLISSKLSRSDLNGSVSGKQDSVIFSPDSPLSRQDLVSWKMALEKKQLPEVDRQHLYQCSGYIDIDKINPDAWPALAADLSSGEQGIIPLAFGYTRLFQPDKPVTKAQAAIALATGDAAEVVSEELARIEAESLAESAVNAHTALVAQVEQDLHASFEKELAKEREKIEAVEKLAEEARFELERLRSERVEENNALIRERAAVESEMEVLSRLRHEVEEQLQSLMSNKLEISFERDKITKLRKDAESENQVIVQLQYELEVERKALSMARAWAEEEAKRAREQARALEEARERWERHGIKVVVDGDLQDDASAGITWLTAGKQPPIDETITRAESLVEKLKAAAAEIKVRSTAVIEKIIQKIVCLISALKHQASEASKHASELRNTAISKVRKSTDEFQENASMFSSTVGDRARRVVEDCGKRVEKINASEFSSTIGDRARKVVEDCKGSVEKITQKFKT
uniref:Uncharacterized protein LOC105034465 isoform X1 n=1 Tax=Elaeis guineensis var. tenera TaxID=51953 RepID=A0A6I9QES2_ELAGV|nr:uncharacterized protein LOC105034465 isoform X1 [Elaeis guineensis]